MFVIKIILVLVIFFLLYQVRIAYCSYQKNSFDYDNRYLLAVTILWTLFGIILLFTI